MTKREQTAQRVSKRLQGLLNEHNVRERAKVLNCEIEAHDFDKHLEVIISAPDGFRFANENLHCMVNAQWDGETEDDVWAAAWERLKDETLKGCTNECDCRD